jgi:hypothetical protein
LPIWWATRGEAAADRWEEDEEEEEDEEDVLRLPGERKEE